MKQINIFDNQANEYPIEFHPLAFFKGLSVEGDQRYNSYIKIEIVNDVRIDRITREGWRKAIAWGDGASKNRLGSYYETKQGVGL